MPQANVTIPAESLILVTGANGFIASHIIDQFLKRGYGAGHFESALLPDLGNEDELDRLLDGVAGVVHVASDVSLRPDPEIISKSVASTLSVLEVAARHNSVTQVILTSSLSAALLPQPGQPGINIDSSTWNDGAVRSAKDPSVPVAQKPYLVYAASKTESEREAWKWVKQNNPGFDFNTVLPGTIFGKILHPEIGGSSMALVRNLLSGNQAGIDYVPPQWFVDVEDAARLHVAAVLDGRVKSERLFAFATPYNWTDIVDILRTAFPLNSSIPQAPENEVRDLSQVGPSIRAESLIKEFWGRDGWTSLRESILGGTGDLEGFRG
ncbi:cinnamoyl-CoA reductase [Aspergillus bombycis]|uniref:Cinnamoyl-CoA reductase n=1 Tax=Aspergillus bombycis TaxID=109264 RepID=A0A1F7ZVB0_9EURO|nr:cinnamoyl-CoA reductase [Aspergillus bombycis]OGM43401.1 cinnamoyl-CoA reductase [Aspergillus bombycis]